MIKCSSLELNYFPNELDIKYFLKILVSHSFLIQWFNIVTKNLRISINKYLLKICDFSRIRNI